MENIILVVLMLGCAFTAGYGVRAITHGAPKRDKRGRFTKS